MNDESTQERPAIVAREWNFYYGENRALHGIGMDIPRKRVTAFIGPSGCGKSTFLRCINRMNDLIDGARGVSHLSLLAPSSDVPLRSGELPALGGVRLDLRRAQ